MPGPEHSTSDTTAVLHDRSLPFDQEAWQSRLAEARAKRQQAIAARQGKSNAIADQVPDARAVSVKKRPAPLEPILPEGKVTSAWKEYVTRPALVFTAGVGVGVGAILGLWLLADAVATKAASPTSATAVMQPAEIASVAPVAIIAATSIPASRVPATVDLVNVPSEAVPPVSQSADPRLPPEITNVVYMRADIAPDEAQALRSLPVVPGADPSQALPERPQVYVHAPSGVSSDRMGVYLGEIEQAGAEVVKVGREEFHVSTTHLRYYNAASAGQAAEIADRLGVEARDFSNVTSGTNRIEIWVAGRPRQTPAPKPEPTNFFIRFLNSL
jgi:hypothetical protein